MPSQEARDAAMAQYDEVLKAQAPEEKAPEARPETVSTKHRDPSGRWVSQEGKNTERMHADERGETASEEKPAEAPAEKPAAKPGEAKPKDGEAKEAKPTEEKPKPAEPERKPFKDLTPEEQRARLNDGYEKLTKKESRIQADRERLERDRQAIEHEKQSAPARMRQELIAKFRGDRAGFLQELAQEAGLDFRGIYENDLTPRMLNGGRESPEELARRTAQRQDDWEANWKRQQSEQLRSQQAEQLGAAKAAFTRLVTADEDAYPFITGMLEPGEIADAALAIAPDINRELGRTATDKEIAERLDQQLKSRYQKSERLRKLSSDSATQTPQGDPGRGNGADVQAANPEGRKPRTSTNGISAKPSVSTRPMTRDERREAALKIPWSNGSSS